jgi:hypothetical protein
MAEEGLTILERRKIEGEIIKPIHRVLVRELGREKADWLIGQAVEEAAEEAGRAEAARLGRGDLRAFAEILPNWARGGALETQMIESSDTALDYDVTRCRYAELYREMGLSDIGFLLSCGRDGAFMKGFAPDVELKRTGTIMTGEGRCDFRYRVKKAGPGGSS